MFRSEIGSGFEDPGGTPPPRIPRSIAGQSNENISHNLIIGNEKKSNRSIFL